MDLLKILSPDQIASLTAEQLTAIIGIKKNRIPELKSLFLSLDYDSYGKLGCKKEPSKENKSIIQKILEILIEYSDKSFYIMCNQSIHKYSYADKDSDTDEDSNNNEYPSNYKLFTEDEILDLVPKNIIPKLFLANTRSLINENAAKTGMYDNIHRFIINKTNNLHIISPHLLRIYGHFNDDSDKILNFIKQL